MLYPIRAKMLLFSANDSSKAKIGNPRFPALDVGYMFSLAWRRLHVFQRLASVACFPALFSRAWHGLHVFPRLASVAFFPALGAGCMFLL